MTRNKIGIRHNPIEIVIVALIFLVLCLNVTLGTFGALVFVILLTALSIIKRAYIHRLLLECWYVFLIPAYCILSLIWSSYPSATGYFALQYFLTIYAAVVIAYTVKFNSIMLSAFLGFGIYAILATLFGSTTNVGADGEIAFIGLAGSKNQSGEITLIAIIASVAAMLTLRSSWRLPLWGFGLIVLLASAYSMLLSKATSSMLFAAIGIPFLIVLMAFVGARATTRGMAVVAVAFFAGLIVLTSPFWVGEAVAAGLSLVGKDVTLTGRTVLWESARELISQRPLLGVGYAGFWRPENPDAQILWDAMKVKQGSPFNFHNTPLNLMVNTGIVGMVLFILPVVYCFFCNVVNYIFRPNVLVIFSLTILACTLPRAWLEVIGDAPFNVNTLIFFLALVYGPILRARKSPSTAML